MCVDVCTEDVISKVLCTLTLTNDDVVKLRDAIEDLYYFEFVIGNSLMSAFLAVPQYYSHGASVIHCG